MFVIDLIERKVGDIEAKVIPLDNLSPEDLDWIKGLNGGMTEEIYNPTYHINKMRNCDAHLIDIDVVRVFAIRQCILLWTILLGNLKKHPQLEQVCAWLNETQHTHKGELMFREREVHEVIEQEGPAVLFGSKLEYALETAPRGGKMVDCEPAPEHYGDSMSEEDMKALFDRGCVDLHDDTQFDKEILLTKVVLPRFEVDFEVEEGAPTELTSEDEINMALDALTSTEGDKDLTLTEEEV